MRQKIDLKTTLGKIFNMKSPRLTPIAFACATVLASSQVYAEQPTYTENNSSSHLANNNKQVSINLNSSDLAQCLNTFAKQADIYISAAAKYTNNKTCNEMTFTGALPEALAKLLMGTGLAVKQISTNQYALVAVESSAGLATLATAVVQSDSIKDGSSADGYISGGVTSVGMWQDRELKDTPYAINVVSNDLIKNLQATSTDQIFKMNPVVQFNRPQAQNDAPDVYMRGFDGGTSSRNGLVRDNYDHGVSMADVERIEVLTGMSGFLYGANNVGGMINYVTKRPTQERLNSVTIGNTSGSNIYAHGDFGGRIDENGDFGYRINLLAQDGETAVEYQEAERKFASLALDWQATDSLLLQLDFSKRDYHLDGRQAYWKTNAENRPSAKALDSDKLWAQKWSNQDTQTDRFGANINWDISENIAFRAAYLDEKVVRYAALSFNTIQDDGTYTQETRTNEDAPHTMKTQSMFAFIDFSFATGNLDHTITTGVRYSENTQERYQDGWSQDFADKDEEGNIISVPLNERRYFAEPVWDEHGTTPGALWKWGVESYTLGDDITFNEQWSALVGITHSKVSDKSYYGGIYAPEETYEDDATTPSVSIIYKPVEFVTTYITYMEAMEYGGTVWEEKYENRDVINVGDKLGLLMSEQIEIGAKAEIGGMLLTAALFEIDKSLEYYKILNDEQAEFVQDGRQVHRGLEFTATGKVTDNLTLVGGFTLLDAKVKEQEDAPEIEGNTPDEVAEKMLKLYGEYTISSVEGLSINAGFSYTGSFYMDMENHEKNDAYTLLDIGARYQLDVGNYPLTFRLNVNNLTDEAYWANRSAVGDGRRVSLSANVNF